MAKNALDFECHNPSFGKGSTNVTGNNESISRNNSFKRTSNSDSFAASDNNEFS